MNDAGVTFFDRKDAGLKLAKRLSDYKDDPESIILALPRGGVPVAYEIATQLHLPIDVFLVRKLGVPYYKELAMGAIARGGIIILNSEIIHKLNISQENIDKVIEQETSEMERRQSLYCKGRSLPTIANKNIILIDDGIATGATIMSAILALKKLSPKKIIVAVPVAAESSLFEIKRLVDQLVCLISSEDFLGVSAYYKNFPQTSDEEVCNLLNHGEVNNE